ncbi:MAG: PAS domain-containing sensor histidine kinase, partial [Hylemonella sp.]
GFRPNPQRDLTYFAVLDMTEREAQAQAVAELQKEQQLILDTANVGLARVRERKLVWVNRRCAELLGYTQQELQGQPTDFIFADLAARRHAVRRIQLHLEAGKQEAQVPFLVRRKDGQVRDFEARVGFLDDAHEDAVLALRDVTDEIVQSAQLKQALHEAEQASEAKSNFLNTMSHEVRTPLNGVMGSFQMLALMRLPERASKLVKVGYETSQLLLAVLNDVLDYSRMAVGKMVLDPRPHKLLRCMRSVQEMLMNVPLKPGVALNFTLDEGLDCMVLVDELRLRQVLMNLVNNAIKFTEGGAVQVRAASLGGEDGQLRVQISVIDTGIGMDEATLARLYEPFMQGSQGITRKYQGTGLGLVIVQNLVQAMGGKIDVHSIVGVGSTFTVELSLALSDLGAKDEPVGKLPISAAGMTNFNSESHILEPLIQAPASDAPAAPDGPGAIGQTGEPGR